MNLKLCVRNALEYLLLIGVWWVMQRSLVDHRFTPLKATCIILAISCAKTLFFGCENIWQLHLATRRNQAYHRFMFVMLVNMTQIITSFAFDFHCLHLVDAGSFGEVPQDSSQAVVLFEFFYYSILNFTFFGYGDVTPQTIPAKLLTSTEIILAFVTVIFILSDFISLKESLRAPPPES